MDSLLCLSVQGKTPPAAALLRVSEGESFNDTGSGVTKYAVEENKEIGGKALKVVFAGGDTAGVRNAGLRDWKRYAAIEFAAFNPGEQAVSLTFTVRHGGTKEFATRADVELRLPPGKHALRVGLREMKNHNGSVPDLAVINHWHLAAEGEEARTVYFGDFTLTGGTDAASTADPARLARIRAVKMPAINEPVMFDTPEADALVAALEIFPPECLLNQTITAWPVHANSKAIVASIGDAKPLRGNTDMAFVLVPPGQKRVAVELGEYKGESDAGPYPVPAMMPVEGWPADYQRNEKLKSLSLLDVQRDKVNLGGDRHAVVVDPVNRMLYELYQARLTDKGWTAAQASIFDLKKDLNRPKDWTSTDAAGLPIYPFIVRYDELMRGEIEHPMRITVQRSRRAWVAPASHFASSSNDPNLPRMGERLRLRADFPMEGLSASVRTILRGLQKYGAIVADNGIDWAISIAPDLRIPVLHEELRKVKGSDFEVVAAP